MSKDYPYDVFLSHNSKDKPRVRRLAERLEKAGLRVWFDEWVQFTSCLSPAQPR